MNCLRTYAVIGLLSIGMLAIIAGCGLSSPEPSRKAVSDSEEVWIAAAWPFKNGNDLFWEGIEMAVKEVNQAGGIMGKTIHILKQDDEASVTKGLEIAQQLADNKKIAAVIGHRNSYISIPAASIYSRAGLLMLSPASTAPELTRANSGLVFRGISSDTELARALAEYVSRQTSRRMVILYDDNAYGTGLAKAFERYANDQGIAVVDRISDYSDLAELEGLKYKWKQLSYDGVFIARSNTTAAKAVIDLKRAGVHVPLYGGNAMDSNVFRELAGSDGEGVIAGSYFNPESSREAVRRFVRNFSEQYRQEPTQYSALGYDAVYLLVNAMSEAKSTNPRRVADALRAMTWEGVTGMHDFDDEGEDSGDLVVIKRLERGGSRTVLE